MNIQVNGKTQQAPDGATVRSLIEEMGLAGRAVAVELNRQVVPRREHESTQLKDGDALELVTLVGGG